MVTATVARTLGIVPPPPVSVALPDRLMKVIAVDDDDRFRRMLSDELAEYGFDVTAFADGAALLAAASAVSAAVAAGSPGPRAAGPRSRRSRAPP